MALLKIIYLINIKLFFLVTNDILEPALELYKSSGFMIDLNYDDQRYERGNTKLTLQMN